MHLVPAWIARVSATAKWTIQAVPVLDGWHSTGDHRILSPYEPTEEE